MIRTAVGAIALTFAIAHTVPAGAVVPGAAAVNTAALVEGLPGAATGRVVTDTFWAAALGTRKEVRIYLPPSYDAQPKRRFPVVYYLHGWSGSERNWVDVGRLDAIADSLIGRGMPEMIIVMPDGDDSWYTTWNTLENFAACRRDSVRTEPASSYCVAWPHYDDYIVHDVVTHVDRRYRTKADRGHRGIAGLSMGGFGAITLALNHPEAFAAAASHSGVLTPGAPGDTAAARFDDSTRLSRLRAAYGSIWPSLALAFGRDTTSWMARDPARIVRRLKHANAQRPALYIDIGLQDRLLRQNRAFHAELNSLGVGHVYREVPGAHNWAYWKRNLPESLTWMGSLIAK